MSTRVRTVMTMFVGAHVVNDFYSTILPAFLPAVADEFDLSYSELGLLSFAFAIATGVLQPVLGSFADRNGKRLGMLVFGFLIGAVGFVAMAVAPSFWIIVLVSSLCGLGGATYHPQAAAFIVAASPNQRGRMLGIHGLGGSVGHFLAPGVAVVSIAWLGWRPSMLILAIPMIAAAGLLKRQLSELAPNKTVALRDVLSRPLVVVAVTFGLVSSVGRSFLTFFVKMLVDEGWSETDAGLSLTVILLVGAVAQPIGGWAFDRFGGRLVFLVAASSTILCIGLFAVSTGRLSLVAIVGIAFFQFLLFPVALAQASSLVPLSHTGTATGVVFGVSGLITASAQPAIGLLATELGDIRRALVWTLPVAVLATAIAWVSPTEADDVAIAGANTDTDVGVGAGPDADPQAKR